MGSREQEIGRETVLITGANGFIGRHLCKLLEKDYQVVKMTGNLFLMDLEEYLRAVSPEYLVNLAWVTKKGYLDSPDNLLFVEKGIALYNAFFAQGGKRAVYIGTEQEYERMERPCKEADTILPTSLYAECKADLGRMLVRDSEIQKNGFIWGRLFFVFGAGEKEARLMPSIIRGLLKGEDVQCNAKELVRDYLDVEDVCEAIKACLFSNYTGAVNIAGGEPTTIGQVADILSQKIGGSGRVQFRPLEECKDQPPYIAGDISLLNSLGYQRKYTLEEGLEREIAFFKEALDEK